MNRPCALYVIRDVGDRITRADDRVAVTGTIVRSAGAIRRRLRPRAHLSEGNDDCHEPGSQ
jgi:hypothetical protein